MLVPSLVKVSVPATSSLTSLLTNCVESNPSNVPASPLMFAVRVPVTVKLFSIVVDAGSINISANNPEQEQGEENLSCDYSGEKIDIAFNVNYLQEILSSIDENNAEIHFFGSDKSCLITCPGTDSYKYVVMPLLI